MLQNVDRIIKAALMDDDGTTTSKLIVAVQHYASATDLLLLHRDLDEDEKALMTFLRYGLMFLESMVYQITYTFLALDVSSIF